MAHMHDMRLWTTCYAPSKKNNLRRLQEIHMLNNEMWYNISNALWKRIFFLFFFFFFVTRIRRSRYMKKYNNDSHDAHWRDTAAHMWAECMPTWDPNKLLQSILEFSLTLIQPSIFYLNIKEINTKLVTNTTIKFINRFVDLFFLNEVWLELFVDIFTDHAF